MNLGGVFDIDTNTTIFKAIFGGSFGSLSFGNVARPKLERAMLLEDLTVTGSISGSPFDLGDVDLVYIASGPPADEHSAGQVGDQQTSIIYDAATGRMEVDAPVGAGLTSINIESAAGIFTGDPAVNLGGMFDIDTDRTIFKAIFGGSFGSLSFGNVARPRLDRAKLLEDLTVTGSISGSPFDLGDVDLVYIPSGPAADGNPTGQVGDHQTSIIYDAATGRMEVDAPAGAKLTSINIESAAGIFTGDRAVNLGGVFDIDTDRTIFKAMFGGSFGSLSFGNVARPQLDRAMLLGDLTVSGSISGSPFDLGDVDLVYISSESPVG